MKSKKERLKAKAWKIFSLWVRNRDKKCVTCGSYDTSQAGHFYHGVLDFDEININRQCKKCNHYLSGNLAIYSVYLINKYGLKEFKALETRHYLALKGEYRTEEDYQHIIDTYALPPNNEKV